MPRRSASAVRQRPTGDLEAQVVRLSRENAALRKEVSRLQVFRGMAYRDPLTGLWNRRYFEERLKEEASRSERAGSERRFSVLLIDINEFKGINDRYGHAAGDAFLKWVGEFLTTHLRTHDVPCRTGGDEFTVLLPDISAEDCVRLVARLREQLAVANMGRDVRVELSLGTASWPEVTTNCERLLAHADEAMYADKRRQKAARREKNRDRDREREQTAKVAGKTAKVAFRTGRTGRHRAVVPVA
jgi:diguanylate cyclase (GGDEF)-like protein